MELFGFKVNVVFLTKKDDIFAYAWHYSKEKAIHHLNKIAEYHGLKGKVKESKEMERWLKNKIEEVVINGKKFEMPAFEYKNKNVYKAIINIPKGKNFNIFKDFKNFWCKISRSINIFNEKSFPNFNTMS